MSVIGENVLAATSFADKWGEVLKGNQAVAFAGASFEACQC